MLFDWTPAKAASNEVDHSVTFAFGSRVFADPAHIIFDVSRPGDGEVRLKAIGLVESKLYCIVYTMRADVCWIISARRTNAREDRAYGVRS